MTEQPTPLARAIDAGYGLTQFDHPQTWGFAPEEFRHVVGGLYKLALWVLALEAMEP